VRRNEKVTEKLAKIKNRGTALVVFPQYCG